MLLCETNMNRLLLFEVLKVVHLLSFACVFAHRALNIDFCVLPFKVWRTIRIIYFKSLLSNRLEYT